ncbi:MAG: HDOD domain-containing protein, partial [Spirochaetaceae bacterium]|nr:HDOD domain-containing protein [Spirochaetaceae bacterium]
KVDSLENKIMKQLEHLLLYTLQFYKMENWLNYFSLLTRGLMYFAIKSCDLENCNLKLIRTEKAFSIQIISEILNLHINKREFIEFINDLSVDQIFPDIFTDLIFLKYFFEIKKIDTDNITYSKDKIELLIPEDKLDRNSWNTIKESIISSIDQFPPLEENLLKLEEMIHAGTYDMDSIAKQVGTDPALTMDIMKIINSGAFVLSRRIDDIQSALKYLGLRELYNLLISLAVKKILSISDKEMNEFWIHSYKCAFYSCQMARELNIQVPHSDSIYTSALLHDIGKFPISMIFDDNNDIYLNYCKRYKINLSDIEDALSGIRHNETGYMMADKWNLPDSLKLIMKYHHNPLSAPDHVQKINDLVYLADCLIYSEQDRFDLSQIEKTVLNRCNLHDFNEFRTKFEHLSTDFDKNKILS